MVYMKKWTDIAGWFDFPYVYRFAVQISHDGDKFVEVGAWLGKSTTFMCEKIKEAYKDIEFYTVDTWEGSDEPEHEEYLKSHNLYAEFLENIKGHDVKPIRGRSQRVAGDFEDRSLKFVFLDGSHKKADVLEDIAKWGPKVRDGGILAGHDLDWPEVAQAVAESFKKVTRWGKCWLVEKKGSKWEAAVI